MQGRAGAAKQLGNQNTSTTVSELHIFLGETWT